MDSLKNNPGVVWGTALLGGLLAWQVYRALTKPRRTADSRGGQLTSAEIRQRQVDRFERERQELVARDREFFWPGELLAAFNQFGASAGIMLLVIEPCQPEQVTPLSKLWADPALAELASQPGQVLPVRVQSDSPDGQWLRGLFRIGSRTAILLLTGNQNLLLPASLTAAQLIRVLTELRQPSSLEHKHKAEWLVQQLLIRRGTLQANDFVPEPALQPALLERHPLPTEPPARSPPASAGQQTSSPALPPAELPRDYLMAQQYQEYEAGLQQDQAREAEAAEAASRDRQAREEQEIQMALAESRRVQAAETLPAEPAKGEQAGLADIVFKLGNKPSFRRRFRPSETIEMVHCYLLAEHGLEDCKLLVLGSDLEDRNMTVEQAKLAPKTLIQIQVNDDAEDSD